MDMLTDDMVEKIVVAGGQQTALQCMLLNKHSYDIATRPVCWKTMSVKRPGIGSLCFMAKTATQCESLYIDSSHPVDAVWFVHGAAMHSHAVGNALRRLDVNIDAEHEDVPNNLVASALAFEGLSSLRIAIRYAGPNHTPTHFFVPKTSCALPTLGSFKFYDQPGNHSGALSVLFGGAQMEMARLHTLKVCGPYTDFFDASRTGGMPALRNVMYLTNEIPLNLNMPSMDMRLLEISVYTGHEARRLFKSLGDAVIDTLILHDGRLMPVFRCTAAIKCIYIFIGAYHHNMTVHIDTERLSDAVEEIRVYGPREFPWHIVAPIQPSRKRVMIRAFRS
jgi:hypothetical protein